MIILGRSLNAILYNCFAVVLLGQVRCNVLATHQTTFFHVESILKTSAWYNSTLVVCQCEMLTCRLKWFFFYIFLLVALVLCFD